MRSLLVPALGVLSLLCACGRPARFPRGGPIRATGLCEASLGGPEGSSFRRASWLAQDTQNTGTDGYGYALGEGSGNVAVTFEDGRLAAAAVERRGDRSFDPHQVRTAHGAPPAWRAEGKHDGPFTEGQWYPVQLTVVSPEGERGQPVELRLRFDGQELTLAWRGNKAKARCAWEP